MSYDTELNRGCSAAHTMCGFDADFWSIGNRIFMVIAEGVVYVGRRIEVRDAMRAYGLLGPNEIMSNGFYYGFQMDAEEISSPFVDYLAQKGLTEIQARLAKTGRPVNPQKAIMHDVFFKESK